ncbi:MAG TPA: DEAD/DEAH box helicase [Kofleriaceae bacterium]|nr:DEAD/DEAH box helicase [Kofleriaceae bacterium]
MIPSSFPAPATAASTQAAPAMRPAVRLAATTIWLDGEELEAATLTLAFDYGGVRVPAQGRAPAAVARDRGAETQARRVLESLGAIDLACLDDVACDPPVDYAVRLDRDVHALCGFTAHAVPQLRALGWTVDIAADYPWQTVEPEAAIDVDVGEGGARSDWFSLELGIEVDGHRVDLLPALLTILEGAGSLDQLARTPRRCIAVPVGDRRYLPVPPERLRLVLRVLRELYRDDGGPRLAAPVARAAALAELGAALHDPVRRVRWRGATHLRDRGYDLALGPRPTATAEPARLDELRADLRPYQREGVDWLQHLRACGTGAVLADDMGLGKTLQTIAHLVAERAAGRLDRPALVITLTSVVGNWVREVERFAPGLRVAALTGGDRRERLARLDELDVAITTYPLVWRDVEELAAHELSTLVLDEAHSIKNPGSLAREAIVKLRARHRIALSGTPVENHLGELWSLMDVLNPGMLGTRDEFRAGYQVPIEDHGEAARLQALRDRVRPCILRRTKDAVAPELPAKTELVRAVELTGAQRELYESIRVSAHTEVRAQIRQRGLAGAQIAILDALLKLRQVCCDPRLVTSVEAARDVTVSAKHQLFLELCRQQLAAGRRILVFSQFARMLGLLSEGLLADGIRHLTLTGATTDRQRPIDAFERGAADVFLISLKAGGTGLNLTSADTVIHYDPWWNPAAQAQATDRAYRIGQKKPVFAFNLIVAGSVEERMMGLQARKRRLADALLAQGAASATALSERELDDLLAPLAPAT